jgi:hypothetical protein
MSTPAPTAPPIVWPDELLEGIKNAIAVSSVLLLLHPRRWIHRRVETIEFLDVSHVRRRMSVDFTVPADRHLPVKLSTGQELVFAPLGFLTKRVLKNFDLRDEGGSTLPLLTQQQNSAVGQAMLLLAAQALLSEELDPHVARDIGDLVGGSTDVANTAFTNLAQPMGPGSHEQRAALWENSRFRTLITDLSHQFVLYVPLDAIPGDRRVLKYQYDEEFRHRGLTLSERLGISPVPFNFIAPSLGAAESYHAEVPAPDEDLIIAEATLSELAPTRQELDREVRVHRTHLHRADMPRGALGWIEVEFRLRRAGFVLAAFWLAVGTTALLTAGWLLHHYNIASSPSIAAALLVALPGIYAAYLARPGEHRIVKMLVSGIRFLIALLATASFVSAAALAIHITGGARAWIWGISAIVCAAVAAVIGLALVTSLWRDRREEREN